MRDFLDQIHQKAKVNPKRIVFAEGEDIRVLKAVKQILAEKIATPIVLGDTENIMKLIDSENLGLSLEEIGHINPKQSVLLDELASEFKNIIEKKGQSFDKQARELVLLPNYFATLMVQLGLADGMVTGNSSSTGDSIRPALQIIPKKEKFQKVSGAFLMKLENELLIFADTAITISPDAEDLVDIAEDTVETALKFGIKPKVAFLSFSTKGSASDESVDKVRKATKIFQDRHPEIPADGELQVDAALVPEIAERKIPVGTNHGLSVMGDANILIFPDLNSGNIAYKLVERLAKARAIGPILQGLTKPINDLSRGCSIQDVIDLTAITVVEAQF
jgi:phosphate acetyltransferase